jgi:hypothetical protein
MPGTTRIFDLDLLKFNLKWGIILNYIHSVDIPMSLLFVCVWFL